jgi:muramoyltetrapeptide carboxypeptidase
MLMASRKPPLKPPALRPGDKVGIIAPASNISHDLLDAGCNRLRAAGYEPVYSQSIFDRDLYFAGSVECRARELEEMFVRDDIRAIVCARGGYGANYLLPLLDIDKIAANPKIFVGYSDITSLLTWFADSTGLVTFHGPMVTKDFAAPDGVDAVSWQHSLKGNSGWEIGSESGARPIVAGQAEGILYGGCLSLLVAAMGTPYDIHTGGTILFLEDVAAKPFQVDRMLMQLKLADKLSGVRGIVFGEMMDCRQSADQDYKLEDVIHRVAGDLGVPVAFGLRSGHVSRANITLPIGIAARLEIGNTVTLRLLDSAVERL